MSEAELKSIIKNGGFQRADTWKPRKNGFASGSRFRKGDAPALDELIIHDMLIPLRPLTILTRRRRLDCTTFLIIWFALLNSSLALRSDLIGL